MAPAANAEILARALRREGNADVTVRVFPGADHLGIVRIDGGRRLAFGDATHFEPGYFRGMAGWLHRILG